MKNREAFGQLLDEVLSEIALALEGVATTGGISDADLWQIMRSMSEIRQDARTRLTEADVKRAVAAELDPPIHPAVEEFLASLDEDDDPRSRGGRHA